MTKYTTIAGDMWDTVAYKTLGDEAYTGDIMKANAKYRNIVVFSAGVILNIPEADKKGSQLLPPWKRV